MKQPALQLIAAARRWFTQPLGELNRWQLTARYAVGIARYGANELREDRASQMAAALTYRTIFSMVPLFVLSLLVFNAFGGFQTVGGDLQTKIYDYLGLNAIELRETQEQAEEAAEQGQPLPQTPPKEQAPLGVETAPPDPEKVEGGADADPDTPDEEQTKARVDQLLADLQKQVASVDFKSIGLAGLGLLIWAGLSLVVSLETSFNRIYNAPSGRPWHLRITIYWAVITLGPVLVALSFWISNRLLDAASQVDAFGLLGWVLNLLNPLASTAATWLLLLLIYKLLPNVKVQLRAALIGALVAAVMWEASKWGFRLYMTKAVGYSALYGSLGLVPLFLLWMYVTWIVILFGLEISYVVQTIKGTRFVRMRANQDHKPDTLVDSPAIFTVAAVLGHAFDQGEGLPAGDIARQSELPTRAVELLTDALRQAGLIHLIDEDEDGPGDYRLSRPAETITLPQLLHAGRHASAKAYDQDHTAGLVKELHDAQDHAVEGKTLRDLLGSAETPDEDDSSAFSG